MATKVLSNEFMQNIATEEAWKELSSNFSWTEAMLEKYQDKVNWDEISENRNIRWTLPMIQKFQKKINWDRFSEYADENVLTEPIIEAFKDTTRSSRITSLFPNFRTQTSGPALSSRDQSNSQQIYVCRRHHIQRTDAQGNHSLGI